MLREMHLTTNLATTSELLSHQRFQSTTEKNVEKEAKWRCHLAQNKVQGLSRADFRLRTRNNQETSDDQVDHPRTPTLQPAVVPNIREMDHPPRPPSPPLPVQSTQPTTIAEPGPPPPPTPLPPTDVPHSATIRASTQPQRMPSSVQAPTPGAVPLTNTLELHPAPPPPPHTPLSQHPTPTNSPYPLTYPSQKPFSTKFPSTAILLDPLSNDPFPSNSP